MLRRYARDHNLRLSDVARAVVSREVPAQRLLDHATAKDVQRPLVRLEPSLWVDQRR